MTRPTMPTGARLAALAFATTAALMLAACEERPTAPAQQATAAPTAGDDALAGAPTGPGAYPYPPTTRSPAFAPPPPEAGYPQPGYPQSGYAQRGYPPTGPAPYGPPQASYPPGYGHYAPQGAPPEIITMAPIPNPPEHAQRYTRSYGWRGRHRHHGWTYGYRTEPHYGYVHHRHHVRRYSAAPHAVRHNIAPTSGRGHRAMAAAPGSYATAPRGAVAPATAPATQLTKPHIPLRRLHHHLALAPLAAPAAAPVANQTSEASTTSEADRYQAMEQGLKDDFANAAQLQAPGHMQANQPSTVTLTLPADFAQTVRNEAAKQNLPAAATSMNLTAGLTGDGYTIVPDEPQNLPLVQDGATVFQWKVTPTGDSRSPLKASVHAQAAGDSHTLALGDKSTGSGSATGRVIGIGLLALIALVLLGWAAQRRRPAATGATRPRSQSQNPPVQRT